jgi:hypothetical protein
VDDIQSRNNTTLPRSIIPFENAVQSRGGKVSWAVIPHRLIESQNINGILQQELKQSIRKGHEIAIHGYNHICPICGNSGHEMFCTTNNYNIPYSQQRDSLIVGLKILLDSLNIVPKCFVPPGHHQDSTTFQVLLDLGIQFLSSNGTNKNFIYKNLFNLKSNNEYTWQITQAQYQQRITSALSDIRVAGKNNGYYCLLLHDPFIREGYSNGIVIQWIGELLDSLNLEYGNKIKYKTLTEASELFKQQVTSISEESISSPEEFVLNQNYPNPFNSTTKISWQTPLIFNSKETETFIAIKLYDVLGKEIDTIVEGYFEDGTNSVSYTINSSFPSGVYFYQFRSGNYIETKKMVYLR